MIAALMLLLLIVGITLSQAVSHPQRVTLHWLRLGGIIAMSLLAVAITVLALSGSPTPLQTGWMGAADLARPIGWPWVGLGFLAVAIGAQLVLVQLGRREAQRYLAGLACAVAIAMTWGIAGDTLAAAVRADGDWLRGPAMALSLAAAGGLLGGSLMTMLLGHAYLTAGGAMTQQPLHRLVAWLAALLLLRAILSAWMGLWPLWRDAIFALQPLSLHDQVTLWARWLVGIVTPAAFIYMIHDCVKRRSNQSATGILYVLIVLLVIGEAAALSLWRGTTGQLLP